MARILDLVEAVLAVGTVPVELPDVVQFAVRVAHPHRVRPALDRLVLINEVRLNAGPVALRPLALHQLLDARVLAQLEQ